MPIMSHTVSATGLSFDNLDTIPTMVHGCPMYLDMLDEPDFSTLDSHLRTPFADVNMDDTMGA